MTPEQFATILVADLDLPKSLIPVIVALIQSQIDAYAPLEEVTFEEREDGMPSSIVKIEVWFSGSPALFVQNFQYYYLLFFFYIFLAA